MKVACVLNIPAPYREIVHENVGRYLGEDYQVIYCNETESNRKWALNLGDYKKKFLKTRKFNFKGRTIYLWSNIRRILCAEDIDAVVIGGFSLPMIIAFFWALANRKKIIAFSDATLDSEKNLSNIHIMVRTFVYSRCTAFIGASKKTLCLFKRYGAQDIQLYQSHLCANNDLFFSKYKQFDNRKYDVLLCGQMIERKMFDFSLDVIERIKKINPDIRVKLLGAGPKKEHICRRLENLGISYDFPGFVQQNELPYHYTDAKVFLFPSVSDPWGVVANEACAAGTPVITCPAVGVADELIVSGIHGYVLPIEVSIWESHLQELLSNSEIWTEMSKNCIKDVAEYNYENAASGIVSAIKFCEGH